MHLRERTLFGIEIERLLALRIFNRIFSLSGSCNFPEAKHSKTQKKKTHSKHKKERERRKSKRIFLSPMSGLKQLKQKKWIIIIFCFSLFLSFWERKAFLSFRSFGPFHRYGLKVIGSETSARLSNVKNPTKCKTACKANKTKKTHLEFTTLRSVDLTKFNLLCK